jgi:hypothetical protein
MIQYQYQNLNVGYGWVREELQSLAWMDVVWWQEPGGRIQ